MQDAYQGQTIDLILGRDFLTWLWFKSETGKGDFTTADGVPFSLFVEQRITVTGGEGDAKESITVTGLLSELREAKLGLSMGKKVSRAMVRIGNEPDAWQTVIKAEDFSFSGFKTPKVERERDEDEDPDAAFLEKMYLMERCLGFIDEAFGQFLAVRFSAGWREECGRVRAWLEAD
jgi:hypothetical protein